jgi:hypothetical protein
VGGSTVQSKSEKGKDQNLSGSRKDKKVQFLLKPLNGCILLKPLTGRISAPVGPIELKVCSK